MNAAPALGHVDVGFRVAGFGKNDDMTEDLTVRCERADGLCIGKHEDRAEQALAPAN